MGYLIEMINGPLTFRFVFQPLIAALLAIRDGRNDAKAGTPAYLHELVLGSGWRSATLKDGLRAIIMPLSVGVILNSILQIYIFDVWRLQWALVSGLCLVGIPYVLVRSITHSLISRIRPLPAE